MEVPAAVRTPRRTVPLSLRERALIAILVAASITFSPLSSEASPGPEPRDCIDFAQYLHMTGTLQIPGTGAPYGYVAGSADAVAVSGSYAFVPVHTSGSDSLYVIDISDRASPRRVASSGLPSQSGPIRLHGQHAFVACGYPGMVVVDISDPLMPFVAATVNTPGFALDIALDPPLAYIADQSAGLSIYDIENPASPQFVGSLDTPGLSGGVAVSGTTAFVADGLAGLLVIDVFVPGAPQVLGSYDTPGWTVAVALRDHHAYVTDSNEGLYVLDVSQPSSPQLVDTFLEAGGWERTVISDHYAFAARGVNHEPSLQVFDIANPSKMALVNEMSIGYCVDVAIAGETAYIAGWRSGFQVLDLTSLESPSVVSWDTPGTAKALALSTPDSPEPYVYVADGSAGLQVYSLDNLEEPERVGGETAVGYTTGIAVTRDFAYVTAGYGGIRVVDIRDPKVPILVGSTDTFPDPAHGIAVSGDYAYVTVWDWWCSHCTPAGWHLAVIDISDPNVPQLVSYETFPFELYGTRAYDLLVSGNLLFVLDATGLWTFDIKSPADPQPLGYCPVGGPICGLAIAGNFAFAASIGPSNGPGRFRILDIRNPSDVQVISDFELPVRPSGISVSADRAYVFGYGYMYVLDIADPLHPSLQGNLSFLGETEYGSGAVVKDGHLIVARGTAGIAVIPTQCDAATGIPLVPFASDLSVRSFPNPTRGNVTVQFSLSEREAVTLRIYDLAGRVVRSLHEGPLGIGTHDLSWDAEDSGGRRVAAGHYWARMATAQGSSSARFVLVK